MFVVEYLVSTDKMGEKLIDLQLGSFDNCIIYVAIHSYIMEITMTIWSVESRAQTEWFMWL